MKKFIIFIKTNILRIFLLVALSTIIQTGFSQNLNWFNSYQIKLNSGLRLLPKYPVLGVMGGVGFHHPKKAMGLNLGIDYMIPKLIPVDVNIFPDKSYLIYYFELTYKVLYFNDKPLLIGVGLEKPALAIDPFNKSHYSMNSLFICLQRQIWITDLFIRYSESIGNRHIGWYFTNHRHITLGINYSFDISRRKSKLNLN
ncbi:MAG: hypothetical protein K9J13_03415 [Saprospiraceae bacterium]|nr:hypothetical protein [Saprospiraceae bacterium]